MDEPGGSPWELLLVRGTFADYTLFFAALIPAGHSLGNYFILATIND